MAYTQSPGRPPFPQTGRGISPTMMSCGSAMKQVKTPTKPPTVTDIELNKSYTDGVTKSKTIAAADPEAQKIRDASMGMTRNFATNEVTANAYEKKYIVGQNDLVKDKIVDGSGKLVSESGSGPAAKREFLKAYERLKLITDSQRAGNVKTINTLGGGTPADNLDEEQKLKLTNMGRATVVNNGPKQMKKVSAPAKQMKKKKC
jgi:hypothetical protein